MYFATTRQNKDKLKRKFADVQLDLKNLILFPIIFFCELKLIEYFCSLRIGDGVRLQLQLC